MKIASLKYQTVFKFVFLKGYCESLQEILEKNWMNEWKIWKQKYFLQRQCKYRWKMNEY